MQVFSIIKFFYKTGSSTGFLGTSSKTGSVNQSNSPTNGTSECFVRNENASSVLADSNPTTKILKENVPDLLGEFLRKKNWR